MTADLPLAFSSPESSTIEGASYDPDTKTLLVTFRGVKGHMSREYAYSPVEPQLWEGFLEAKSRGNYFAHHIRPMFSGRLTGGSVEAKVSNRLKDMKA